MAEWVIAIQAVLQNPMLLSVAGLAVKFIPGLRKVIANDAIGFINVLLAFFGTIGAANGVAHLGFIPFLEIGNGPMFALFQTGEINAAGFFGLGGAFSGLGIALWNAGQGYLINALVLKHLTPQRPGDSKRFMIDNRR